VREVGTEGVAPVRVEKALGLLPEVEALAPLRSLLVSIARPDERALWSSSGPYLTLGKRGVLPEELRRRMPQVFHRVGTHLEALYTAYVQSLECQQRDDGVGVVEALLRGGRLEEGVGRLAPAQAWYAVALRVSEALQDRRPELETLQALGHVCLLLGRHADSGRHYQRCLALAEAEFDQGAAIAACEGLGATAQAQAEWVGAEAWYARGVRLAEAGGDAGRTGALLHELATLARRKGDLAAAAEHLRRARGYVEPLGEALPMARVLNTQGQLDAQVGRDQAAAAAYREALAWLQRAPGEPVLESSIRLNLARLHIEGDRFLEAEEELRRAEQLTIAENLMWQLVQIYTLLGTLRGRQLDETGFVFFEQAIELSRMVERASLAEARVYEEYGLFQLRLGDRETAKAYLERAREMYESGGEAAEVEQVRKELQQLSA
jgi:tetratricopeptide (TPR) repeat protein